MKHLKHFFTLACSVLFMLALATPSTAQLVAHYTMDDNAATTNVVDSSPNGLDGTMNVNTSVASVPGKVGTALDFAGTCFVDLGLPAQLTGLGDFTVSMWIKGIGNVNQRAFTWTRDVPFNAKLLYTPGNFLSHATITPSSGNVTVQAGAAVVGSSTFLQLVWTQQGNSVVNYLDCAVVASGTTMPTLPDLGAPLDHILIGAGFFINPGGFFTGIIDDVQVYDRALTQTECQSLFNNPGSVIGAPTCTDNDGDGYGNPGDPSCPNGPETDCNDNNSTIFPGASESCNGEDDDCDGQVDEGFDQDGDGFTTCNGDCDDNNDQINPDAPEVCDGADNNCNGQTDEGFDQDNDGIADCFDNCPFDEDNDGDGVCGDVDFCAGTVIPELVSTVEHKPNRWALVDGDFDFDTVKKGKGNGPGRSYTTTDTGGCSCEQIIAEQGLGQGHTKHGCSISAMDDWVALVAGAPKRGEGADAVEVASVPEAFVLEAVYPNPFNPQTTIRFGLPESAQVTLVVYDVLGRPMRVLVDGTRAAGTHEVVFEAGNLPSGTYLVRLVTPVGSFVQTMQLVK